MSKSLTLTAKLVVANARIAELEAQLAALQQPVAPTPEPAAPVAPASDLSEYAALHCGISSSTIKFTKRSVGTRPTVTRFTKRDGTTWEKVKTGFNQWTSKQVVSNA